MPRQHRRYATMNELAEEYGFAVVTIRKWIASGRLAAYRVGGRAIRVDRDEFEALIVRRVPSARKASEATTGAPP